MYRSINAIRQPKRNPSVNGKDQYKGWWKDLDDRNVKSHPVQSFQHRGTMEQIKKLRRTESSCWDSVSVFTIKGWPTHKLKENFPKTKHQRSTQNWKTLKVRPQKCQTQAGHLEAKRVRKCHLFHWYYLHCTSHIQMENSFLRIRLKINHALLRSRLKVNHTISPCYGLIPWVIRTDLFLTCFFT